MCGLQAELVCNGQCLLTAQALAMKGIVLQPSCSLGKQAKPSLSSYQRYCWCPRTAPMAGHVSMWRVIEPGSKAGSLYAGWGWCISSAGQGGFGPTGMHRKHAMPRSWS